MEERAADLSLLPRRPVGPSKQKDGRNAKECVTNYFELAFKEKFSHVYQFCLDTQPEVPADSKELLREITIAARKQAKEKIHLQVGSGNMLWALKDLPVSLHLKVEFTLDTVPYKFDVVIKPTKKLETEECLKTEAGRKMIYQMLNNELKQLLREKNMDELTRGKYYDQKEDHVKNAGLCVIRGYKFTLCTLEAGLCLQIDVCSRVFREDNLLQELMREKNTAYEDSLIDSSVLTRYGKRRSYKILAICRDLSPLDKFYHDKRAGMISYAEYFKESYNLRVTVQKQPLIKTVIRQQKKMVNGELVKTPIIGYLIPEFVSLTGMSDQQRANHNTMKDIAPYTKLEPNQRMERTTTIINSLNNSQMMRIGKPLCVRANKLNQPYVRIEKGAVLKNNNDGSMVLKHPIRNALHFRDWVVVYSQGRNRPKQDDEEADMLVDTMMKASSAFGIKFNDPGFITCDQQLESWKNEIKKDVDKNGKPQIVLLYLTPNEEKFYGALKRFLSCELKVPCQAVRRKSITRAKNPLSTASKIVVQMNQKAGGTAWELIPHEGAYTQKLSTMYGAFAISRGKKGYTLAFTGTTDKDHTKIFSHCKTGYKSKENIPQVDFENMLVNWAKMYVGSNKKGPELIIIYREGLSQQQIKRQVPAEIGALSNVIKKIAQKTSNPTYCPEIVYTVVNTKINTRIFDLQGSSGANRSNSKFVPLVRNPSSGTVVFSELSVDRLFDFHLAAQVVTQGTCTPTHYIVAHSSSKITEEDLAYFTYEQCFNYYNWTGAVKVPAALQCANKLAKLVGEAIQADVNQGDILTSYYFL